MGKKTTAAIEQVAKHIKSADNAQGLVINIMMQMDGAFESHVKTLEKLMKLMEASSYKTVAEAKNADKGIAQMVAKLDVAVNNLNKTRVAFKQKISDACDALAFLDTNILALSDFVGKKSQNLNPLKKKSLGDAVKALEAARRNSEAWRKVVLGCIDIQEKKGNYS